METGILKIESNKPDGMIQCGENSSQGNHTEFYAFDVIVETMETEKRCQPSLGHGDQEVPGVESLSMMKRNHLLSSSQSTESGPAEAAAAAREMGL